jgi:hypothetical protein
MKKTTVDDRFKPSRFFRDPFVQPAGRSSTSNLDADREVEMTGIYNQGQEQGAGQARWNVSEWHGRALIDCDGEKIGKLQDVYVDVETDESQFATVKEGFIGRHLTFVPLGGVQIGPDDLQVQVTKERVGTHPTSRCTVRSYLRRTSPRSITTSR